MGLLIDTSVLVGWERGVLDLDRIVEERLRDRVDEPFYLSVVTVSELLHGVHRAGTRIQWARRSAFVEAVLDVFPVVPLDLLAARTHARLGADLVRGGSPIGTHDLWIAATAVSRGWGLATLDRRHFERVPGLEVEDWG